jgi:hypothetical protein
MCDLAPEKDCMQHPWKREISDELPLSRRNRWSSRRNSERPTRKDIERLRRQEKFARSDPRGWPSHRLQVRVFALVELFVGVAHGLGPVASEHDLKVNRLETVVLVPVDHAGRTGDAFPGPDPRREALAAFVLNEDVKMAP